METYEQALFDVHKAIYEDIENKLPYESSEYLKGMLDAAIIVLTMISDEVNKKEGEQND